MDVVGVFYFCQDAVDAFDDGGDVVRVIVEMVDDFYGCRRFELAIPFVEAAAGGGEGIVRVERQQDELVVRLAVQRRYRFSGVGMPRAGCWGGGQMGEPPPISM